MKLNLAKILVLVLMPLFGFSQGFLIQAASARANSTQTIEVISETSPIVKAIDDDRSDLVLQWIKSGHSPNARIQNKMNERLFDRATLKGSVKVTTLLLKAFRHFKIQNKLTDSRGTPILVSLAALDLAKMQKANRYEKIIQRIIRIYPQSVHDADHAYIGDGRTALHQAAANGNLRLVKYLIKKGARVDEKSTIGETPLHFAARAGNIEVVKHLILARANINAQTLHGKETPLILASEAGQEPVIKELLLRGANRNIKDAFGKTAHDRFNERVLRLMAANHAPAVLAPKAKTR